MSFRISGYFGCWLESDAVDTDGDDDQNYRDALVVAEDVVEDLRLWDYIGLLEEREAFDRL